MLLCSQTWISAKISFIHSETIQPALNTKSEVGYKAETLLFRCSWTSAVQNN